MAPVNPNPPQFPGSPVVGPAAIYVHWPFCLKKCPYCDFNSHVRDEVSHDAWRDALLNEISHIAARYPNLSAKSIFFGGGTPSLMEPETTAAVISAVKSYWAPEQDIEITLEANPSSVEAERFKAYAQAGINRLSVGVQSLNDEVLKFLGRLHSADEALAALKVAQNNFERVSFDLIYARPDQTVEGWKKELKEAISFGTSHMSLYQLTIEEGTAFYHQFERGKFKLPDEKTSVALFEETQNMMAAAGMPAYETSNHAKPGEESQHNLAYWQGEPYVGIGPGAHGRLPTVEKGAAYAHAQIKRPEDWLAASVSRGTGLDTLDYIPAEDRAVEAILTGLRLTKGVDITRWQEQFSQPLYNVLNEDAASELEASGHIHRSNGHLRLSRKGRPLLNFILGKLIA
ncbi:MAG: radical SAM family heme chaperone HemW [Kordiimonadaceae bacterium]|nr:radical SAM family heme chaperone HemW [Kordiimonadaceae bacterium]